MRLKAIYIMLLLAVAALQAPAQEVLRESRIQARATRRHPLLGLPRRADGQIDPIIWHDAGSWKGADSRRSTPFWTMSRLGDVSAEAQATSGSSSAQPVPAASAAQSASGHRSLAVSRSGGVPLDWGEEMAPVRLLCEKWLAEKPHNPVDVVWGPYRGGWFAAVCKRTGTDLGWKALGFIIPAGGPDSSRSLYIYSCSVNKVEHLIHYDLFPRLPSNLQEIIEEITAAELLCPFQEFDPGLLDDGPDHETDYYDWEVDAREP